MHRSENGRRKERAEVSPHYSIFENRKYPDARSSRSDWREHARLIYQALQRIASFDTDRAHFANGMGFSKSDGSRGHWYVGIGEESFIGCDGIHQRAEALVIRYRRQLPPEARDYFDMSKRNRKQISPKR